MNSALVHKFCLPPYTCSCLSLRGVLRLYKTGKIEEKRKKGNRGEERKKKEKSEIRREENKRVTS